MQACGHPELATAFQPIEALMRGLPGEVWPIDIRTAIKRLELSPDIVTYACCKKCYSLFGNKDGPYPEFCTFRETKKSKVCGGKLTIRNADGEVVPLLPYAYQPMTSWLARLLSRPGIEDAMRKTVDKLDVSNKFLRKDIFDADVLRQFQGPITGQRFLDGHDNEHRLVFSFFVDWFNPFLNKQAGKKASIGGIYMVCMNLPIHL